MKFPEKPLRAFKNGYMISTANTPDMGLETMVFPCWKEPQIVELWFTTEVRGVDFGKPLEELTRHYKTVEEAKAGHREIVKIVRGMPKHEYEKSD